MTQPPLDAVTPATAAGLGEREILLTLFDLGRQVASVVEVDQLLHQIPGLIGRLVPFDAFAVYLFNDKRDKLRLAYGVGYPEGLRFTMRASEGILGRVVSTQEAVLLGDVTVDPHYIQVVPEMRSTLAVPLRHKAQPIGALNLLSREPDRYTERDAAILRQFAAHVAVALVNARLFEQQRLDAEAFETLAEIGREMTAVLDLDALLARIAELAPRLITYRTFGILLLNDETKELEMKLAVQYGEKVELPRVLLGEGLVGYAALHREPVNVPDVSQDPRYINVVEDVRAELAVPLLVHDRCIGVLDVESPQLGAFTKRDVGILSLLASQAAIAIENARLYAEVSANEARLDREIQFAKRVQAALLPSQLPKRVKGVDVAARFAAARELGGDFHDFLVPESSTLVVAVGDVSGKGVPAALYSVFAGELVRGRTFRRRHQSERSSPAQVLASINAILQERQIEEYYCTLCYAIFDLKRRLVTLSNSGLPYPIHASGETVEPIELPGVPLGSFLGIAYDDVTVRLQAGDVFVFCSDGVMEAMNRRGEEFGSGPLIDVITRVRHEDAAGIAGAIVDAVDGHRAGFPPNDDVTVVVVRIG